MKRRFALFATAALLLLGVVLGATTWHAITDPPIAVTPPAPSSGYGFATPLDNLDDAQLNQQLSDMQAMGITWVRYDVNWSIVQQDGPTSYNWADTDRIAKAVHDHHMRSLMLLDFTPPWARVNGCDSQICAPARGSDYGIFAATAAQRYQSDGVNAWEIWNEPNISAFFKPSVSPSVYSELLKSAYTNIKKVEPNSIVIVAGPAPASTADGNLSPTDFIKAVYASGAHGYFDAMADHPYTYPHAPSNQDGSDTTWGQLKVIHDIMVSHQDGGKQIWVTEYGDPTGGPTSGDHNTEAEQATMLNAAFTSFQANPWAGPFFWFKWQDDGSSTSTNENFFGLLRPDGSQKPAYNVYLQYIKNHPLAP